MGGNWPTLPEFRVVAAEGSYLQVSLPSAGRGIRVDYDFAGGEAVVIDCQGETVLIDDADLGDTVAVIDTSRSPEWRLTARIVRCVRTFGESVVARVTVGTAERADYEQVSALVADVATLRDDVVGIDGNLSTAASMTVVESTVTTAIDDLDELGDLVF